MAPIVVSTVIRAPRETVWRYRNAPEHIVRWDIGSDDWHTPSAENDPREGGKFKISMAAKDASVAFDFEGTYTRVIPNERLEYEIVDGRRVTVTFDDTPEGTRVTETFDPEDINGLDDQRAGWQWILDRFKSYVEADAA